MNTQNVKLTNGYYWVMVLDSGEWEIARYDEINICWHRIGHAHIFGWELAQIGERIPSNESLLEIKKFIPSI